MGLVKALLFFGFVALGLLAAFSSRNREGSSYAVNAFLVYSIVLGLGAGLSQHEVWPFSTWPLVAGTVSKPVTHPRFVAIDSAGREYQIDFRAWEPLEFDELMAWEGLSFFRLDTASRDRVAAYLLSIIERARERWAAGSQVDYFRRYLGPLSAPLFLGHPSYWDIAVPAQTFVGLRLYDETWDVEERSRDPSKVSRKLVYEYRRP